MAQANPLGTTVNAVSNAAHNVTSSVASNHGGGAVPFPVFIPLGYGGYYGGGRYSNFAQKKEIQRRRERIEDKYGIETENFEHYRDRTGKKIEESVMLGCGVGLLATLLFTPLIIATAGFGLLPAAIFGLAFGLLAGSIPYNLKMRKDVKNFNAYLDQEEAKGKAIQKEKEQGQTTEKSPGQNIEQGLAMEQGSTIIQQKADTAYFDNVAGITAGATSDPKSLNANLQPQQTEAQQAPDQGKKL